MNDQKVIDREDLSSKQEAAELRGELEEALAGLKPSEDPNVVRQKDIWSQLRRLEMNLDVVGRFLTLSGVGDRKVLAAHDNVIKALNELKSWGLFQ